MYSILAFVFGILMCLAVLVCMYLHNKFWIGNFRVTMGIMLAFAFCMFTCVFLSYRYDKSTNQYYLEAEVLATDSTSKVTVFTSEQGKYSVQGVYYDIAPYLLTMDDKGTNDTADDEIIVVWRAVG